MSRIRTFSYISAADAIELVLSTDAIQFTRARCDFLEKVIEDAQKRKPDAIRENSPSTA